MTVYRADPVFVAAVLEQVERWQARASRHPTSSEKGALPQRAGPSSAPALAFARETAGAATPAGPKNNRP